MFALEINFRDGVSESETVFIRRPQAVIGASDYAHVVVDDMRRLGFQIRIVRDLGRKFRWKRISAESVDESPEADETHEVGQAKIDFESVSIVVTALDSDVLVKENETPDRAGVRVLRRSSSVPSPIFPAVAVGGSEPMVVSFVPDQPIYIGRSKQCEVRLDSANTSARHARMGYESGQFWIEDLGSTNGTFVNNQQISGRVNVPAGVPAIIAREIPIIGIDSDEQVSGAARASRENIPRPFVETRKYPAVISVSEVARPARLVLPIGQAIHLGRDPQSDMWLGAPHVSRKHCSLLFTEEGTASVTDHSTNGTSYGTGILKRGDTLNLENKPRVLDFGGGVTVAICFSEEDEKEFVQSQGAPTVFFPSEANPRIGDEKKKGARLPKPTGQFGALDVQNLGGRPRSFPSRLADSFFASGPFGKLAVVCVILIALMVLFIIMYLLVHARF